MMQTVEENLYFQIRLPKGSLHQRTWRMLSTVREEPPANLLSLRCSNTGVRLKINYPRIQFLHMLWGPLRTNYDQIRPTSVYFSLRSPNFTSSIDCRWMIS